MNRIRIKHLILVFLSALLPLLYGCSGNTKKDLKASIAIKSGDRKFQAADFQGAIKEYRRAVMIDSGLALAHIKLGNALFCIYGGREKALKEYNKAELLSDSFSRLVQDHYSGSSYSGYHKWVVERIQRIEEETRVIHDFSKAIDSMPGNENIYSARAFWKLLMCDFFGALSDYKRVIELNGRSVEGYYGAGMAEYNLQNYQGSITYFYNALNLEPQNTQLLRHLAAAKAQLGDTTGAITELDHALLLDPGNARLYMERALCKLKNGDKTGAKADLYSAKERCDSIELAGQIGFLIAVNE